MNFRYKNLFSITPISIFICIILVSASFAVVPPIPHMPSNYVVDLAGIIDDNVEQRLNGYLQELEQKTTAQVVVLTITSLEGESIEEFSITTAHKKWKLGQKGKDNGVLITISLKDRKYRFEIGYGLEAVLPDSLVGSIGRKYLVPYFQKGDYSTGIYTATLALINEIASSKGIEITGMPKLQRDYRGKKEVRPSNVILLLFIVLSVIFAFAFSVLSLWDSLTGRKRGRRIGWWSGGFGSGGFGGFGGGGGSFGGGGGGGFGGGGASGGW